MILAQNNADVQPDADYVPFDCLDAGDPAAAGLIVAHHDAGDGFPWALCLPDLGRILDVYRTRDDAHRAAAELVAPPIAGPACSLDFSAEFDPQGPTDEDLTSYRAGLLYTPDQWNELVERAALDAHHADLADRGLIGC